MLDAVATAALAPSYPFQIIGVELAATVEENERVSLVVADLRQRVAEQDVEAAELTAELKAARESAEAGVAAGEASATESREVYDTTVGMLLQVVLFLYTLVRCTRAAYFICLFFCDFFFPSRGYHSV